MAACVSAERGSGRRHAHQMLVTGMHPVFALSPDSLAVLDGPYQLHSLACATTDRRPFSPPLDACTRTLHWPTRPMLGIGLIGLGKHGSRNGRSLCCGQSSPGLERPQACVRIDLAREARSRWSSILPSGAQTAATISSSVRPSSRRKTIDVWWRTRISIMRGATLRPLTRLLSNRKPHHKRPHIGAPVDLETLREGGGACVSRQHCSG